MGSGDNGTCFPGVDVCRGGMMDKGSKEWRNLTFSQREGKAPLPEPLQAGKLTKKFRNRAWRVCAQSIENCALYLLEFENGYFEKNTPWKLCYEFYSFDVSHQPHDEIPEGTPEIVKNWLRTTVLYGKTYEVLTVLEYILRFPGIPEDWTENIKQCFEVAPYTIDQSSEPVCIFPTTSKEMEESVERSLANINQSELTGAKSHFRSAAQALNNNEFSDSVRESIHAVEAATLTIAPESPKSFSVALNTLEQKGMLKHGALKEAFGKLYGYTSDEKGIRHSLTDSEAADVEFDEAIFMYGACVSFVDYLVSKQRQLEEVNTGNEARESSFPGGEG